MKTTHRMIVIAAAVFTGVVTATIKANPGDLYVSDNTSIHKFAPDGTHTIFAATPYRPRGLAFDKFGNLFVSTLHTAPFDGQGRIITFAPNGAFTLFLAGLHSPEGIAFHKAAGNLFDTDNDVSGGGTFNQSIIQRITPNGSAKTLAKAIDSDFSHLFFDAAFDSEHNLFVADAFANAVLMITPSGKIAYFATVNNPDGLAFDSNGNLFVSDQAGSAIIKITPDGSQSTFATNVGGPRGLAFDAQGNLFAAGHDDNNVYKIAPDGTVSVFAIGLNVPQFLAFEPLPVGN